MSRLLLALGFLLVLHTPGRPCTCVESAPPLSAMAQADAVFIGRVVGQDDPSEASSVRSGGDPIEYRFELERVWKGVVRDPAIVVSERDGAACGFAFRVGNAYLVYASSAPDAFPSGDDPAAFSYGVLTPAAAARGVLRTGLCTRTRLAADANEDLAALPPPIWSADGGSQPPATTEAMLEQLGNDDASLRLQALHALGDPGVDLDSRSLLPRLERFTAASEAESLSAIGLVQSRGAAEAGAVAWLARGLQHRSEAVRRAAAEALGKLPQAEPDVVAALGVALERDADDSVRRQSAESLRALGPRSALALPALIRALADEAAPVRSAAARALGAMGPAASAAVEPLARRLGDDEGLDAPDAADALAAIGAPAIPALCDALRSPQERSRWFALRAVAALQPVPAQAVTLLAGLLEDEQTLVRAAAAGALARSEGAAEIGMASLVRLLAGGSEQERGPAADELRRLGSAPPEAIVELVALVNAGQSPAVRIAAVRALGALKPMSVETASLLERLRTTDPNPSVRLWADRALARTAP
ncbi:MAG TPA: HEAT repeat domain-containing protein [Candidatus Polarisedimenticolaceae bacterium]|nr:HEAT repeat domain-containing protein [Candidatus Polarisedimenticolaceae bacterium]